MEFNFKDSKTFTVVHTEYYEPTYGTGDASAALVIPDDFFTIDYEIKEVSLGEIEGKHSDVYVDVYTVKNLTLEEAVKLFKKYSNVEFDDLLADYYLENVETKVDDDSLWGFLSSFQKEVDKMLTSKEQKVQEAINRLKKENLTEDTQHNKDVVTLINYLTEELSKNK
jgi:hypothetical protein